MFRITMLYIMKCKIAVKHLWYTQHYVTTWRWQEQTQSGWQIFDPGDEAWTSEIRIIYPFSRIIWSQVTDQLFTFNRQTIIVPWSEKRCPWSRWSTPSAYVHSCFLIPSNENKEKFTLSVVQTNLNDFSRRVLSSQPLVLYSTNPA